MSAIILMDIPLSVVIHWRNLEFLSGIINIGAYADTSRATKPYGRVPRETIVAGDMNADCITDPGDFSMMVLRRRRDNNL